MKARPLPLLLVFTSLPQSSKVHKKGWGQMARVQEWGKGVCK